ncbi:hypothetical protein AGLY_014914 [Aphis glycines]|uniref:Uncharacterized protein n=1 Tax=Aphis glycines TaxID=307491 RepID=A0A6G0T3U3_APHGL|nr:hypothetical protein AGLY_014914 [Aphis glycines]
MTRYHKQHHNLVFSKLQEPQNLLCNKESSKVHYPHAVVWQNQNHIFLKPQVMHFQVEVTTCIMALASLSEKITTTANFMFEIVFISSISFSIRFITSSSPIKQGATKLNPRNSSWALALGGTHGESEISKFTIKIKRIISPTDSWFEWWMDFFTLLNVLKMQDLPLKLQMTTSQLQMNDLYDLLLRGPYIQRFHKMNRLFDHLKLPLWLNNIIKNVLLENKLNNKYLFRKPCKKISTTCIPTLKYYNIKQVQKRKNMKVFYARPHFSSSEFEVERVSFLRLLFFVHLNKC